MTPATTVTRQKNSVLADVVGISGALRVLADFTRFRDCLSIYTNGSFSKLGKVPSCAAGCRLLVT